MVTDPRLPHFRPSRAILALEELLCDVVAAAEFPQAILRYRNQAAAREVGLDPLSDGEWVQHFGRFEPLNGSLCRPRALRYHGHQFRHYNPELGDGRGFLFAQMLDSRGRLMDLGTKGSGTTPWSRRGDGRLTLKGAVREILATEMLAALGVTTSRTFSVIETGEALERGDEPSPTRSAVLVRLSHGHIRYGSFQRLAALEDDGGLAALTHYVLDHFADGADRSSPYAALMDHAVAGAARLVAEWHVAGFVHGVLNTDNINITGESFDYGPWRFLPAWDMGFTAAYFDQFGLYAFGRQAEALHWNLFQLAGALKRVAPVDDLIPALKTWPERVAANSRRQALWRLGLEPQDEAADIALLMAWESALAASGVQPDRAWFDWRGGRRRQGYDGAAWAVFAEKVADHPAVPGALDHPYWADPAPCTMLIEEVEALWRPIAEVDDWAPLNAKIAAIRRMGTAHLTSLQCPSQPSILPS
ncbi:protein adenylyltransferase SelO family protein [Sandaracinobacteroides saxicola]|uniref:YdiU family protein n=1 Tax=Sandaracinobacteroides saxicola TaxID=2759707 RepID=A0A7G5IGW4_9SPHN|nr:YdiU family protein [Sandaracinobacteroides saxicola]QMW22606.1 YdiU family protein [Sandaracinobacteroides saxicola]